MNENARILIVDDDPFMREMVSDVLGGIYRVIPAENGSDALMLAQAEPPDLILLDVDMPGMDGYETCIRFKQADALASIPLIFVSGLDQIDERLKGYEVGGNDYVVKPFNPQELKAKIAHLLGMISERAQLKEMASYAASTAMTAMTSMSEMGALLESLKKFNASIDEKALAVAVLSCLSLYGLGGVVQVRTPEKSVSLSGQDEASPLEVSVIEHMSGMDRIVQFKNRMSIHYPHVSMLVNNMPMDDADRCGRLRDHLAMLVEGAEMRAAGIAAENESRWRGAAIERAVVNITKMLAEVDAAQRQSKLSTAMAINEFTGDMERAYICVALSNAHEDFMVGVVKDGLGKILNAQSAEVDVQNKLTGIIRELKDIAGTDKR
ncbi:MAG: response regulator [Nitrosomonadales bacterium]|nr:response regulator [Nitrosomonadales bacterium]